MICRLLILISISLFTSCASINSAQKAQIAEWKGEGVYVEAKSPSLAAGLNCVLGIGDFYNGNIGYGIANLLTWPLSILWAPVGGYDGALLRNWEETTILTVAKQRKNDRKKGRKNNQDDADEDEDQYEE